MTAIATAPKQAYDLVCPECGAALVLKRGKFGLFYGCSTWDVTRCDGMHSAHQSSGAPQGVPGDNATRKARRQAHATFDTLWQIDDGMCTCGHLITSHQMNVVGRPTRCDIRGRGLEHSRAACACVQFTQQQPAMTRREAYRWVRAVMQLSKAEAHIGLFTSAQCNQLITAVRNRRHFTVEMTDDA